MMTTEAMISRAQLAQLLETKAIELGRAANAMSSDFLKAIYKWQSHVLREAAIEIAAS